MEPIIAGNWKMNKEPGESRALVQELMALTGDVKDRIMILIPPFTSLPSVGELIRNSRFKLGAQNMHWERSGAFTGEISGLFLKAVGCEYVVIGHSERRHIMGETDEVINKKLNAALEIGLIPIFCVGEQEEEREAGKTEAVIQRQIAEGLKDIENEAHKIVFAYEPVWAIGTGKTATPQQVVEVHRFLRGMLKKPSSILYGGSVKPENVDSLMKEKEIQGALVGGASLKPESFARIIKYR
ncbi:triosephosphate isomerase [candidate division WOR_3 bacterium SM1_77]|uniref:Triosephosphate isomerase n=1 Tax=candidate division WOR_3 bacterium SM1_77 TaxID=1703778 RepID=A0A0S8JYG0_UNCW3|nr:MAG: triosephosphate isomerase [candidate division WOR_3 bacterium SM1_77]